MTARGCWYDRDTHRRDTNGFAEDRMIRKLGVAAVVVVVAVVLALASVWWALLRAPFIYLSETVEGKRHDKKLADDEGHQFPHGSKLWQDTGYQGYN